MNCLYISWVEESFYISWQLFASMRQTLCIDLSRWKAPTVLWSRRSGIFICIMRRRAALQLSIWLKVELAGDGQGWLSNIYPCNGNSYYHHVHIMLQFDTCYIICICSVLPLSRWTPTLGQRSWSGILGLAQVLGCTALHQQLWVLQLSKGLPCIKNLFWGRLVYWSGWFKSWRYIVEGVICIIPNKPVFQVEIYWSVPPRFRNDEDHKDYKDLITGLADILSQAWHRPWTRKVNFIRSSGKRSMVEDKLSLIK